MVEVPTNGASDSELVIAIAQGDKPSFETLVRRYGQFVYANSRSLGASHELAEDVLQMVWVKLMVHSPKIRKPGAIKGWLAITCRNTTRTELGRSNRDAPFEFNIELVDPGPEPGDFVEMAVDNALLGECFETLREVCQELLWLKYGAELSLREIAAALDKNIGYIGPTQGRCLADLETCLGRST